jgi:hypothetical protein
MGWNCLLRPQRVLRLPHLRQKTCLRGATLMLLLLLICTTNNGWGTTAAPSPALTQESYHGFSDESMEPPTYGKYGKNSYHKGFKGKGHKGSGSKTRHAPHSQGKRGRDSYEDDKRDREVKQKTWNADGKTTDENWSKSLLIRTYTRNLTLEQVKTLLNTLKQADIDFQHKMKSVHIESWHETTDDNLLHLHKALGMPINLTVSPHFYYQAAQWPCNNAINMLANTELLDKSHGTAKWLDLFQQGLASTSTSISVNISQLGDHKIRDDYRIAKHYVELQTQVKPPYQLRRHHFYLVAIIHNDKRPTRTFLDKNTYIQITSTKTKRPTYSSTDFSTLLSKITSTISCKRLSASLLTTLLWSTP